MEVRHYLSNLNTFLFVKIGVKVTFSFRIGILVLRVFPR